MSEHPDLERLVAWWMGELAGAPQEDVEAHLFACGPCAARAERLAAIDGGIAALAGSGVVDGALPDAVLDRLVQRGVRVRTFEVRAGEHVPCAVAPDDDLMNVRLVGDFTGVVRLDVAMLTPDGAEQVRFHDVLLDPAARAVNLTAVSPKIRALPSMQLRFRALDVRPDGERSLGDFVLDHSATPLA